MRLHLGPETEPAKWSDFGFIGNLDMRIVFTFKTSVVVKSTITLLIMSTIVTDFDLLNNSFGIQQGQLLRRSSGCGSITRTSSNPQEPSELTKTWRSLGSTRLLLAHFSLEEATALGFTDLFGVMRRCDGCIGAVLGRPLVLPTQVHVG